MSKTSSDATEYVDFMASQHDIRIKAEWKPIVVSHVETARKMMNILESTPVSSDSIELANVYTLK